MKGRQKQVSVVNFVTTKEETFFKATEGMSTKYILYIPALLLRVMLIKKTECISVSCSLFFFISIFSLFNTVAANVLVCDGFKIAAIFLWCR